MLNSQLSQQQPDALSIAFVDTSLSNTDVLLQGLQVDRVIMLDDQSNGIEQISQILDQYSHTLESIHIFSPGEINTLKLGNIHLTKNNFSDYEDELVNWGEALADKGDILLYGSELAKKSDGRRLVRKIARLIDADVAASRDLTGSSSLNGDWDLEYSKGNIEHSISPDNYQGLLSTNYVDDLQVRQNETSNLINVPTTRRNTEVVLDRIQPSPQQNSNSIDTTLENSIEDTPDTITQSDVVISTSDTQTVSQRLEANHNTVSQDAILNIQFESHTIGRYTENLVDRDWQNVAWANLGDRARIVNDSDPERGQVLEITYPRGAVGSRQSGSQFEVSLPEADELWLSYSVKFGEGFDFRKGGKLPGLTSSGSDYTGGRRPSNGDGWSARYMWRENGTAIAYPYYVDMQGKWGEAMPLEEVTFHLGQWHQITQHIKLNTNSQANGVLETWVDGKKVQSRSDLRLRLGNKGKIDSFYFSTFHGGKGSDWAPRVNSKAFFDSFVISKNAPDSLRR
ncbi:MAG: DUF4347 domain-containing protein [Cyanobacteria bacterium P01_F01_bin.13]